MNKEKIGQAMPRQDLEKLIQVLTSAKAAVKEVAEGDALEARAARKRVKRISRKLRNHKKLLQQDTTEKKEE